MNKKTSLAFQRTLDAYLSKEAEKDPMFAERYNNPEKSLEECCDFIIQEVQKSGCNGFADEEIYGLAKHYYDEDDLGEIKKSSCNVVVNHVVELTEEEKAEARKQAIERQIQKEMETFKAKPKMKVVKEDEQQLMLF